jgi:SAM-dependent methyltransferase
VAATDWFAGDVAERYDAWTAGVPAEPVVDFLLPYAGGGALELAIGTGRIAVPLAAAGVDVAGIDLSPDMVAQLRRKTDTIPVVVGDMCTTRVDRTFSLVFLVFSSLINVTTQDGQAAVLATAAAHLDPGGVFVVEVDVPALRRLAPGERRLVFGVRDDWVGVEEYDTAEQSVVQHHQSSRGRTSVPCRYVWPSELDLMARLAGLELRERWADWDRSPFTAGSTKHVSVWEKTA